MAQPPRFQAREKSIFDTNLSNGAVRLYCLLDDQSKGNPDLLMSQYRLAVLCGCTTREIRNRMRELEAQKYLKVRRTGRSNTIELNWSIEEQTFRSDRNRCSDQIGTNVPILPYKQERQQEYPPNPPQAGGIDILQLEGAYPGCTACPACGGSQCTGRSDKRRVACVWCQGRGFMWPRRSDERMAV